jgi:hypothetical protein
MNTTPFHFATMTPGEESGAFDFFMEDQEAIRLRLEEVKMEHRDLDDAIARVAENPPFDQIKIQRLKKRKLVLKDEISRLEDQLLPDIIA